MREKGVGIWWLGSGLLGSRLLPANVWPLWDLASPKIMEHIKVFKNTLSTYTNALQTIDPSETPNHISFLPEVRFYMANSQYASNGKGTSSFTNAELTILSNTGSSPCGNEEEWIFIPGEEGCNGEIGLSDEWYTWMMCGAVDCFDDERKAEMRVLMFSSYKGLLRCVPQYVWWVKKPSWLSMTISAVWEWSVILSNENLKLSKNKKVVLRRSGRLPYMSFFNSFVI